MKIPKAAQIRGIKKALHNRKTPKQFLPGLRKRLRKLGGSLVFLLAFFCAVSAHAQAPVSLLPTQQVLAPTGTPCTGSAQVFPVNNRNQTQHYAYVKTNSAVTNLVMQIQGLDAQGNVYVISDTVTTALPINGANSSLLASGYFPTIQVVVTCLPVTTGTFSLNYSGSQATVNQLVGSYLIAQQDKTISASAGAGSNYFASFQPPFGSSYGTLFFAYGSGAGPAGSTVQVSCFTQQGSGSSYVFNPVTTTAIEQTFVVPTSNCPNVTVTYTAGTTSTATYSLDYVFAEPGLQIVKNYSHITGTGATEVKGGSGRLFGLNVGTPAAGTISLFDLAPSSCTGTPSSNVVSVVTATTSFPAASLIYDTLFQNGICVKASAAMDITITYQ